MITQAPQKTYDASCEQRRLELFLECAKDFDAYAAISNTIDKLLDMPHEMRASFATNELMDGSELLAHAIVASSETDPSIKKRHYETALAGTSEIRKTLPQQIQIEFIFGFAVVGLAALNWNAGNRAEAIAILESARVNELDFSQDLIDTIRFMYTSFLICEDHDQRAREILDGEAVPTAEWYYLNALLKFRQLGDGYLSRGAISLAFVEDQDQIAELFCDTECDTEEFEDSSLDYCSLTRECWTLTPGALDWLERRLDAGQPRVNQVKEPDARRRSRVDEEVRMAHVHMKRDDMKLVRKCLKAALREADRLNDGGARFFGVLKMCQLATGTSESSDWYVERLDDRLKWLKGQESSVQPAPFAISVLDLAYAYGDFQEYEKSADCASRTHELLAANKDTLDAFIEYNTLRQLGRCSRVTSDCEGIEKYARAIVELKDSMIGPLHLDVVDDLQHLRYALHELGKHDEEREIAKRVYVIDHYADRDPDLEDLEWCENYDLLPPEVAKRLRELEAED